MQKTALKAFLCSFSVSMLAISVANSVLSHEKDIAKTPLEISKKNISLFIKDQVPQKHPAKKINLVNLDPLEVNNPSLSIEEQENEGIVVADEADLDQEVLVAETGELDFSEEDEDQKIFLAEVVYSAEKPLEKLTVDEQEIYSPNKDKEKELNVPKEIRQEVVYADTSSEEPSSVQVATNTEVENKPLPIAYDQQGGVDIKVSLGDPSDLNHVALKTGNVPIESMEKEEISSDTDEKPSKKWQQMKDNPWLVARSNGAAKNQMAGKDFSHISEEEISKALNAAPKKDGVQIASETVKNLIIPLPEKLADNENLTPRLAYPEESEDAKKEKIMSAQEKNKKLLTEIEDDELSMSPEEEVKPKEKKSVLSSLGEMLAGAVKNVKDTKDDSAKEAKTKQQARRNLRRVAAANRAQPISPREIKMSFQANRAEISGQTLRWVQAFAVKAAQEEDTGLEVRVDGTRPTLLQQRRLNLLYNILTNKGVEYSKINVVFTSREPNSFILRMTDLGKKEKREQRNAVLDNNYVQW